jgi:hypothetical protein
MKPISFIIFFTLAVNASHAQLQTTNLHLNIKVAETVKELSIDRMPCLVNNMQFHQSMPVVVLKLNPISKMPGTTPADLMKTDQLFITDKLKPNLSAPELK